MKSFFTSLNVFILFSVFLVILPVSVKASSPYNYTDYFESSYYGDGLSPTLDTKHHRLFVSDSNYARVLVYDLDSSNNLLDYDPDHVLGQINLSAYVSGTAANQLYTAGQTAYDSVHDRLFVPDTSTNCRVMVYDTATITDGEPAVYILGGSDINAAGTCGTSQNQFNSGQYFGSVAYDESLQYLYVSDTHTNNRILIFNLSDGISNGMNAFHVLGSSTFNVVGAGDQTATGISDIYPNLTIDSDHKRLFVSLYNQKRVLVFDVNEIVDGEPAAYVLGQPDFTSSLSSASLQGGRGPVGLGYDPTQQLLFVSDYSAANILVYDVKSITNGEDAIGILNYSDPYPYDQANIAYDSVNRRMFYGDDGGGYVYIFEFIKITTTTLPDGTKSAGYSTTISTQHDQGTKSFSITSGSLPPGLTIDLTTGVISGVPTTTGVYSFTVTAYDDNGDSGIYADSQQYSLTLKFPPTAPEGERSTTDAPVCTAQAPSAPDLFQVDRSHNSATVHFTPLSDNVSSYLISYGTDDKAEGYSMELPISHSDGVVSQTINELNPSTSYYFKVRAQKGCMPGDWSTVKEARPIYSSVNVPPPTITNSGKGTQALPFQTRATNSKALPNPVKTHATKARPQRRQTTTIKTSTAWYESLPGWFKNRLGL